MLKNVIWTKTDSREQRGDTIVEVLISIAIVSLVLAGAYAITNRNLSTTQDSQEHGQALQFAQQQIELLRAMSQQSGGIMGFANGDCMSGSSFTTGSNCNFNINGTPGCTVEPCFKVTIDQGGSLTPGTYGVLVQWASLLSGSSNSQVELDYRI
ncbi:MAG: type IV pilus modification PilV family protein [Candidatus Saccharimonadales bacterium]